MKDRIFVDSNILLYLLSDDDSKKYIAKTILKAGPIISSQVVSENVNVLFKKFKRLSSHQISEHITIISTHCNVLPVTIRTIEKAFELKDIYGFQWYDSTILSSALLEQCSIIYSEDMQHNQIIEGRLKIINPFL